MRLASVSRGLTEYFRQTTDKNVARRAFEEIFWDCASRIDSGWYAFLDNDALAGQLTARDLPKEFDFSALSNEMDEKYFETDDERRSEDSHVYFRLARLMSSLSLAKTSKDGVGYSEAAYEAIMSLPNPKEDLAILPTLQRVPKYYISL